MKTNIPDYQISISDISKSTTPELTQELETPSDNKLIEEDKIIDKEDHIDLSEESERLSDTEIPEEESKRGDETEEDKTEEILKRINALEIEIEKLLKIAGQMDELKNNIDVLNTKITALTWSSDDNVIQERLDKLEEKLSKIESEQRELKPFSKEERERTGFGGFHG